MTEEKESFKCDVCDYETSTVRGLSTHKRLKHSDKKDKIPATDEEAKGKPVNDSEESKAGDKVNPSADETDKNKELDGEIVTPPVNKKVQKKTKKELSEQEESESSNQGSFLKRNSKKFVAVIIALLGFGIIGAVWLMSKAKKNSAVSIPQSQFSTAIPKPEIKTVADSPEFVKTAHGEIIKTSDIPSRSTVRRKS